MSCDPEILLLQPLHLFFFHRPPTPDIYTLSLHDALPISFRATFQFQRWNAAAGHEPDRESLHGRESQFRLGGGRDRKSTRLNSSHQIISYAVFCLKKKKQKEQVRASTKHAQSQVESTVDH